MEKIRRHSFLICIGIIFVSAIILRSQMYLYARPFWNDECALANNIIHFNIINCFKPLQFSQAVPPIFMVISDLISKIIPSIEFALRFFPLIASILSMVVFYYLAQRILNKKSTILLAMIFFCFNYRLIYYAQEFKQYSSDVLIFLSILTSYFYLDIEKLNTKKLISIGFIYATLIWASFTSLFALFTIFSLLILKNIKSYKKLAVLFLPVVVSFVCFYIFQHLLAGNEFLLSYWKDGFISHNFNNFIQIVISYFSYSFNSIIIFFLFLAGLGIKLFDLKNKKSLVLLIPTFLALLLSYFSIYPLESRVSLYLIPICILFAVQILDYINFKNKVLNYVLYSLIIFFASFPVIINSTYKVVCKDYEKEDIITPLVQASKIIKENDILYIPDGSELSYNFYKSRFNFKNVIIEKQRINDSDEYIRTLEKLPRNKTYYYIFCHSPNKAQRLRDVYLWAKNKKNFKIYADKYYNALIVFTQ